MSDNEQKLIGPSLVIKVGNEYLEHGVTQVQLTSDGQLQIANRSSGKEQSFEHQMPVKQAHQLLKMSSAPETQVKAPGLRRGLPDEPLYEVSIYQGKVLHQQIKIWRSDLEEYPEIAGVIQNLQQVIDESTKGKILL
jgi:hypothetical protein